VSQLSCTDLLLVAVQFDDAQRLIFALILTSVVSYSTAVTLILQRNLHSQRLSSRHTTCVVKQGDKFYEAYTALLRDTGRMTAEELVQKHLGVSIEDPEFWRGSARIIEAKIDALEAVMEELGL
jgi:oligoendopeptidase F